MFEKQLEKLAALKPILNAVGDDNLWGMAKFLYQRLKTPDSYVVFIGETSSGKSTVINGLLGKQILPVSAAPTTGAITEVTFDGNSVISYEALYRSGMVRKLEGVQIFANLALKSDKDIARLRVNVPSLKRGQTGMRIFDTPGYNSIVEEHEEVLKDFLPNADAVVYIVGYKIGIQEEDFTFIRFLRELLRPSVPVILVVNRCPENVTESNPRIREIKKYASDILGEDVVIKIVYQAIPEKEYEPALPVTDALWSEINRTIGSSKRLSILEEAFDAYIDELFDKCEKVLKLRLATAKLSHDQYQNIVNAQKETSDRLLKAIPELIEPTFKSVRERIPTLLGTVAEKVGNKIIDRLCNVSKFDKDEEIAFINNFYMPEELRKATDEDVQYYIQVQLADLNSKVDDYINQELIKLNHKITIQIESALDKTGQSLIKKYASQGATNALGRYFLQFGGNGGAGAGVANAASHALKKVGDFWGKRFTRETHNALKHYLAKFGATSMKAVSAAVAGILELGFDLWDMATWKGKVKKNVVKSLGDWKKETCDEVIKDLDKLEKENKDTIREIANDTLHAFDDEKPSDYEDALHDAVLADQWKEQFKN